MRKKMFLAQSTLLLGSTWMGAAFAQVGDAGASALEEVVVTAQRRTENLQDVPISAVALSAEALNKRGITRLIDLQTASPSLSITDTGFIQTVNIRGIGLASDSPNVTAGVAVYVDGLFQPPIVASNNFYDLASIEVLRGPQGTLVGSNSTGGAVFINSQSPVLGEMGGYAELDFGNHDALGLEAAVNIPLGETLALRLAGFDRSRDSYYNDIGPFDNDAGRQDEKGARLGVLWQPGAFEAVLKASFNDRETGGYPYRPVPGTWFAPYREGDIRTLSFDAETSSNHESEQASLELRYELASGVVIRSLSGYQDKLVDDRNDIDASQAPLAAGGDISNDYSAEEKVYSQEINIISPTDGRFDWILGAYYQRNDIKVRIYERQGGFPTDIMPDNERTTIGLFGQGNYQLTDQLELQIGARQSYYEATGEGSVWIGAGIPGFPPTGLPVSDLRGSYEDNRVTGKVALNYQVHPDHLIYGLVARGYKPGGFNSTTSEFDPETVLSYELGWKASFLDNRVRTQLNIFYNDYADFQYNIIEPTTGFNGVDNIAEVTTQGFEGQIQAKLGGLSFDASVGYVDSDLSGLTFVNTRLLPPGTQGPQCGAQPTPGCFDYSPYIESTSGGPNLYAPEWTYSGGVEYEFLLTGGTTLTPRLNYAFIDSQYTYLAYSSETDRIGSRGVWSAVIALERDNWRIEAYGNNLTDEDYVAGQSGNLEFYGPPREYGVRLALQF